jgi:LysR family hydrogen peroxide-inducible transcriptional activator
MVTLSQFEYILAVEECRHFGRAAKACHVSQPTLSMQLQKAEDFLDVIIFDRSKNPIMTTQKGSIVVEQARIVLREYQRIYDLLAADNTTLSGDFRLGVIPTLAPYIIPLFVESFCETYPDVNLYIEEMKTEAILSAIKADQLDGGLLVTPLKDDQVIERTLFLEPMLAFVGEKSSLLQKDKLSVNDIKRKGLWILNEGNCFRDQVFNLCQYAKGEKSESVFPNLSFEGGSIETLKTIVSSGNGHTVLPFLSTTQLSKKQSKQIKPFKGAVPCREVSLVHSRIYLKEKIINAIEDAILLNLPNELASSKNRQIKVIAIQ